MGHKLNAQVALEQRCQPSARLCELEGFFGRKPVSMIDAREIDSYKAYRIREHRVRDITLRHDLHALSTFFAYAVRQHWTRENPVRHVEIPSDKDAVRIHIISSTEEKLYFERAAKYPDLHESGASTAVARNAPRGSIGFG